MGDAPDGADAPTLVADVRPDVVLKDIRIPRRDGLWATREILARPEAPAVLVLTTFDADDLVLLRWRCTRQGRRPRGPRPHRGGARRRGGGLTHARRWAESRSPVR